MNAKEKAPTSAATLAEAAEKKVSYQNYTPNKNQNQLIITLLPRGRANAIKSADLARLAGMSNIRQLQAKIARERDAGAVILSTCRNGGGYYLPAEGEEGRSEVSEYVRTLRARALHTLQAVRSAQSILREIEGQVTFHE